MKFQNVPTFFSHLDAYLIAYFAVSTLEIKNFCKKMTFLTFLDSWIDNHHTPAI